MANLLISGRRIIYWTVTEHCAYFVGSLIGIDALRNCGWTVATEGANQVGRTGNMRNAFQNSLAAALLIVGVAVSFTTAAHAGTDVTTAVPVSGSVSGITRNALGEAVPWVKVTAHRIEGDADRSVVSGVGGNFGLDDLKPGHYKLMASNEGATSSSPVVEVAAGQKAHVDLIAANSAAGPDTTAASKSTNVADPGMSSALAQELAAM
jgi:Carboxypeptidase regulatory-like domain